MAPPRYTRRPAGARGPRQADARSGGVFLPPRLDDRPGKAPRSSALAARGADIGRAGRDRAMVSCPRSEEHTSELQSLMRSSYAVFCLKKKKSTTSKYTN